MAYVLRGPTRALVIGAALLMTATIQGWSVLVAGAEGESPAPALLSVDLPSANAMIQNGDIVDVAGWTDGSRVDIYLDGPAGIGAGLGSTIVHEARPDVVSTMAMPALVDSGFDFYWEPLDLSAGPHTLYVYSLVNGTWMLQTLPIAGVGNVVDMEERGSFSEPNEVGSEAQS